MRGQEDVVKRVLTDPDEIYQSNSDPNRQLFYRPSELPPPQNLGYVRVVVDYHAGTTGAVITALHVDKPKSKDVLLWSRGMQPLLP